MKIRLLAVALICATTGFVASSALAAGTSAVLPDNDSVVLFGSAKLSNTQQINGDATADTTAAIVDADALRGASGNVGVNLAAGALNAQTNQIALITTPQATIETQQHIDASAALSGSGNSAVLGAGALARISGNIGVNIASGVANAQYNGMVIH